MNTAQILDELPRLTLVDLDLVRRRAADLAAGKKRARRTFEASSTDMDAWEKRLEALHAKYSTGKTGAPLQQIMDDIRGDR